MTAQDLINGSLRLIGVLTAGRSANTYEYAECLSALNQLLSAWSAERVPVYELKRETIPLTGAASYTIGPSGTLNATRPVAIRAATVETAAGASAPVKIASAEEFGTIQDPAETGLFADLLCADGGFPLMTLRLWPRPATGTLVLHSIKPLGSIAALDTAITLPPGYEAALRYNLAVAVAPEFRDAKLTPEVLSLAELHKNAVVAANADVLKFPAAVAPAPEVAQ